MRSPYAETGWVDESSTLKRKSYGKKTAASRKVTGQPKKRNWWEPPPKTTKAPKPKAAKPKPPPKNPIDWWIQQSVKSQ